MISWGGVFWLLVLSCVLFICLSVRNAKVINRKLNEAFERARNEKK